MTLYTHSPSSNSVLCNEKKRERVLYTFLLCIVLPIRMRGGHSFMCCICAKHHVAPAAAVQYIAAQRSAASRSLACRFAQSTDDTALLPAHSPLAYLRRGLTVPLSTTTMGCHTFVLHRVVSRTPHLAVQSFGSTPYCTTSLLYNYKLFDT